MFLYGIAGKFSMRGGLPHSEILGIAKRIAAGQKRDPHYRMAICDHGEAHRNHNDPADIGDPRRNMEIHRDGRVA